MTGSKRSALVVGASGLVGTAAVDELASAGWRVTALSRRRPETTTSSPYDHLSVDLLDLDELTGALESSGPFSHVVYAAAFERPGLVEGWSDPEQMQTNLRMLANVLGVLAKAPPTHVTLMQGTKAYGVHLHPIPLPARERQPRDPHANFYWLQEDHLKDYAARHGTAWTILRPVQIVGPSFGVAYNTPPVIGAFAALARELGLPFGFPGARVAPVQAVDVTVVGQAIRWAAESDRAWGEHFNLTNGEVFSWPQLWPSLADVFGLEAAPPSVLRLSEFLPAHADTWHRIVQRHGLRELSLDALLGKSHEYADYTFGTALTEPPPPALVSDVKVRLAGFTEVRDTEVMFRKALETLIERRVLPR